MYQGVNTIVKLFLSLPCCLSPQVTHLFYVLDNSLVAWFNKHGIWFHYIEPTRITKFSSKVLMKAGKYFVQQRFGKNRQSIGWDTKLLLKRAGDLVTQRAQLKTWIPQEYPPPLLSKPWISWHPPPRSNRRALATGLPADYLGNSCRREFWTPPSR